MLWPLPTAAKSTVRHVVPQITRAPLPYRCRADLSPAKRNRWCKQATKQPAVAANIRPRQRVQKSGEGNLLRCYICAESIRVKHYQTETAKAPRHCRDQKWPLRRRAARAMVPRSAPAFDHHLPAHATRADRLLQEVTIGRLSRSHCNRHRAHTGKLRIGIMNCGSFCTRSGRISCILLIASTHNFTVFEQHGCSHTEMRIRGITRLRGCLSRFDQTHIGLGRNVDSRSQNTIRKMETGLFHWIVKIDNGLTANLLIIFSATNVIRLVSPEIPVQIGQIWPFFRNLAPQ